MPTHATLTTLLPLAGAIALTIKGVGRMSARRASQDQPRASPPRPQEMPYPTGRSPRQKKSVPDGSCEICGTSVPARETLCALCERKAVGPVKSSWTTALNWLVLLGTMTTIIGGGWLLSH